MYCIAAIQQSAVLYVVHNYTHVNMYNQLKGSGHLKPRFLTVDIIIIQFKMLDLQLGKFYPIICYIKKC